MQRPAYKESIQLPLWLSWYKNLPVMQETWVQSLGWEDPLEKGKANHSSFLAWRNPWAVQSLGSQSPTRLSDFHFHSIKGIRYYKRKIQASAHVRRIMVYKKVFYDDYTTKYQQLVFQNVNHLTKPIEVRLTQ